MTTVHAILMPVDDDQQSVRLLLLCTEHTLSRVIPQGPERFELFYADSAAMVLSPGTRMLLFQALASEHQVQFWNRRVIAVSRVVDRIVLHSLGPSVFAYYRRSMSHLIQ